MKNNNTTGTNGAKITLKGNSVFYEPNMKQVQTDVSKSISDRLDKMESMLLYSIDKMGEIDRKLDGIMDDINIRMVGKTGDDIFKRY
jgi:DNA replication protein DnaC